MRKLILGLIIALCCIRAGFGQAPPKTLVVYYSRTGNTEAVAKKLAEKFDADIETLIDKRNRDGLVGYTRASKDALAKNLTDLEPLNLDPDDYDIILIGTPSWYGNLTPAVRTFLAGHDLSGKCAALFGTTNKTGIEGALRQGAEMLAQDAPESIVTLPLRTRDLKNEGVLSEKISRFYESVMEQAEIRNENVDDPGSQTGA